jgi:hypothetical protein
MASKTFVETAVGINTVAIEGIDESVILQYFMTLNEGNFDATSQLFTDEGMLQPPFEAMVVGPDAIAAYLAQEAKGFILLPQQGAETGVENGDTEFLVVGRVQTPWFTVNVSWTFIVNTKKQLVLAKVNLLASLQELMHMRR